MTQTVLTSPTDVVSFLVRQHEQIKSLFDATLNAAGEAREKPFTELRRLLAVHEAAEEVVVHPRVKHDLAPLSCIADDRLAEEKEAKKALIELEDLDVASPEFTSKLRTLRDAVVEHAEHEENEEFTIVVRQLTSDDLEQMVRAVKLAELIAPTMPHPDLESRAANVLVGPFVAMVDRVRDAIVGHN